MIDRRVRERNLQTINYDVKYFWMLEVDQLREEKWQEFDEEDKEKSNVKKSDKSRAVDACKPNQGAAQVCAEITKKDCPFKLMMGTRTIVMPAQGLSQLHLPALPRVTVYRKYLDPQHSHRLFCPDHNSQTTGGRNSY